MLRRLHDYSRASMTDDRLSDLALIRIHYSKDYDYSHLVDVFAKTHTRRMELESVL